MQDQLAFLCTFSSCDQTKKFHSIRISLMKNHFQLYFLIRLLLWENKCTSILNEILFKGKEKQEEISISNKKIFRDVCQIRLVPPDKINGNPVLTKSYCYICVYTFIRTILNVSENSIHYPETNSLSTLTNTACSSLTWTDSHFVAPRRQHRCTRFQFTTFTLERLAEMHHEVFLTSIFPHQEHKRTHIHPQHKPRDTCLSTAMHVPQLTSSYSPSDSSRSMYSTFSRSLNPPPYPLKSGKIRQALVLRQIQLH